MKESCPACPAISTLDSTANASTPSGLLCCRRTNESAPSSDLFFDADEGMSGSSCDSPAATQAMKLDPSQSYSEGDPLSLVLRPALPTAVPENVERQSRGEGSTSLHSDLTSQKEGELTVLPLTAASSGNTCIVAPPTPAPGQAVISEVIAVCGSSANARMAIDNENQNIGGDQITQSPTRQNRHSLPLSKSPVGDTETFSQDDIADDVRCNGHSSALLQASDETSHPQLQQSFFRPSAGSSRSLSCGVTQGGLTALDTTTHDDFLPEDPLARGAATSATVRGLSLLDLITDNTTTTTNTTRTTTTVDNHRPTASEVLKPIATDRSANGEVLIRNLDTGKSAVVDLRVLTARTEMLDIFNPVTRTHSKLQRRLQKKSPQSIKSCEMPQSAQTPTIPIGSKSPAGGRPNNSALPHLVSSDLGVSSSDLSSSDSGSELDNGPVPTRGVLSDAAKKSQQENSNGTSLRTKVRALFHRDRGPPTPRDSSLKLLAAAASAMDCSRNTTLCEGSEAASVAAAASASLPLWAVKEEDLFPRGSQSPGCPSSSSAAYPISSSSLPPSVSGVETRLGLRSLLSGVRRRAQPARKAKIDDNTISDKAEPKATVKSHSSTATLRTMDSLDLGREAKAVSPPRTSSPLPSTGLLRMSNMSEVNATLSGGPSDAPSANPHISASSWLPSFRRGSAVSPQVPHRVPVKSANNKEYRCLNDVWLVRELTLPDESPIWSLGTSADGKWLAAGVQDGSVRLWRTLSAPPGGQASTPTVGTSVGNRISSLPPLIFEELPTVVLKGHTATIVVCRWDSGPVGSGYNRLASASLDRTVRVWTIHDDDRTTTGTAGGGARPFRQQMQTEGCFEDAILGGRGHVNSFCTPSCVVLHCTDWPTAACFHPTIRDLVYTGALDGTIQVWRVPLPVATHPVNHHFDVAPIGERASATLPLGSNESQRNAGSQKVEERHLNSRGHSYSEGVAGGIIGGAARLMPQPRLRRVEMLEFLRMTDFVTSMSVSPNGSVLAVGLRFGRVSFYDSRTLGFRTEVDCRNRKGKHSGGRKVTGIVWTGNGSSVCVSTSDSRLRLIALEDGSSTWSKFKGHVNNQIMLHADFSPSEQHVVCGSENSWICVWDIHPHSPTSSLFLSRLSMTRRKAPTNAQVERFKAFNELLTSCVTTPSSILPHIVAAIKSDPSGVEGGNVTAESSLRWTKKLSAQHVRVDHVQETLENRTEPLQTAEEATETAAEEPADIKRVGTDERIAGSREGPSSKCVLKSLEGARADFSRKQDFILHERGQDQQMRRIRRQNRATRSTSAECCLGGVNASDFEASAMSELPIGAPAATQPSLEAAEHTARQLLKQALEEKLRDPPSMIGHSLNNLVVVAGSSKGRIRLFINLGHPLRVV